MFLLKSSIKTYSTAASLWIAKTFTKLQIDQSQKLFQNKKFVQSLQYQS